MALLSAALRDTYCGKGKVLILFSNVVDLPYSVRQGSSSREVFYDSLVLARECSSFSAGRCALRLCSDRPRHSHRTVCPDGSWR